MMIEKEALNFILQDVPESIVFVMFCFVFLNLKLRWKQMLIITALLSLTDLIEVLPLAFGIRALILMIALVVYIKMFTRRDLSKVFIAVFITFLLSIAGDSIWGVSLQYITALPYDYVYNTPYLRALFSYPTLFTILAVAYLLYRYKKKKMINFE